jgi:glycosyltransferase involved in cell wall biosynthesis
VVYNAPEVHAVKGLQRKLTKSLVYMGTFMPYKNVEAVIRGVALLAGFKLELLSRISPAREAELKSLADEVGANVEFHRGVSDERYHDLLGQATALVSASLDEGFGIPVVEAMAQGVPVVVSDIPIFREVAGAAGRFFEPSSPKSFAAAINAVEANPPSAKALQAQAEKFSWDASATELLKLIEKI